MSDEADRGNDTAEFLTENARHVRKPELVAFGGCHYCGEVFKSATQLFCDGYCREDYEALQLAKLRSEGRY